MPILCRVCRNKNIVEGYKLVEINKFNRNDFQKETVITQWCKECLTKYANSNTKFFSDYIHTKLRDTNIEEYNSVVNSHEFIAEIYKTNFSNRLGFHQ